MNRAQILLLPDYWTRQFETEIRRFMWRGQPVKNVLSLETICLPKNQGGLGIPHLRSKCEALHLKQALRMLSSPRNCRDHICFWSEGKLGAFGLDENFKMFVQDNQGRKKKYRPKYFRNMIDLLLEGIQTKIFSLTDLSSATTKIIFHSFTDTMPPPKLQLNMIGIGI